MNIWWMLIYVTRYCLINFLRAILFVIAYFLNHTSCLYPDTVYLWVTDRVPPLTCTVILFTALTMLSTRSKFHNISIVEQLYNNITFLRSNLISLVCFCLKKTSSILFLNVLLHMNPLFYGTPVVWCNPFNQSVSSTCKCKFSSPYSSELVNSDSSWSVSSIMIFKVVNAFLFSYEISKVFL